jgi:hypothetical protein
MDTKKIIIAVASVVTALFLGLGIYWTCFRRSPIHLDVLGEGKTGQKMVALIKRTWDITVNPKAPNSPTDPNTQAAMKLATETIEPIIIPFLIGMSNFRFTYTAESTLSPNLKPAELREYGKRLDAKPEILTAIEKLEKSIKDAEIKRRISGELLKEIVALVDLLEGEKPLTSIRRMLQKIKKVSSELLVEYPTGLGSIEVDALLTICSDYDQ